MHGNGAAAGGWMARAVRLIEAVGDCAERARIELTRAVFAEDPVAREQHLATAVEIAQRCGANDIVLDAMSQRGLHLVAAGQVDAGMALLDEALAAVAAGEVRDVVSVGAMYCKMLHACELTCDVRRATDWLALADRFVQRTNRIPIGAICRTHYGGVLTAAGRWSEAERELRTALQLYDRSYRALRAAAVVRLAGLRVRQGRLAEAAELLVGAEHDSYAVRPQVELHLARGEAELAAARAERFLRERGESELTAPVLLLLVRAHLARADHDAAAGAAKQLHDLAAARPSGLLAGFAEHAAGLVAATAQDTRAARHLETALGVFGRRGLPLEEARARLDLAQVLATRTARRGPRRGPHRARTLPGPDRRPRRRRRHEPAPPAGGARAQRAPGGRAAGRRPPHPPRTGSPRAARTRPVQRRHRHQALRQPTHRRTPRLQHPGQTRPHHPRRSDRARRAPTAPQLIPTPHNQAPKGGLDLIFYIYLFLKTQSLYQINKSQTHTNTNNAIIKKTT